MTGKKQRLEIDDDKVLGKIMGRGFGTLRVGRMFSLVNNKFDWTVTAR